MSQFLFASHDSLFTCSCKIIAVKTFMYCILNACLQDFDLGFMLVAISYLAIVKCLKNDTCFLC